jgi:hypothetical protein
LHPPAVRVFEDQANFAFANPAAIVGPSAHVATPRGTPSNSLLQGRLTLVPRVAGVIGAEGGIAGFTAFAEWRDPTRVPPKDRDFALGLGPVVVTTDELEADGVEGIVRVDGRERTRVTFAGFDWNDARKLAQAGTTLKAGDLLAGPGALALEIARGSVVELELVGIGVLDQTVLGD